ncbi:hypothetical protein NB688_002846 [Xanthomonas sacchari]|uniref:A coat protein n=1 Tax=Xanthomonas sacchari TaxID=56458 RepID=A0ABT3DWE1_9XANT|nr:A coat protein [Xanthomonas sacchari]MCW0399815.1 hypothetical protein [Xanthomonas sacchari]MCW0420680.1 hypothetical protein [Xanthomonas sacchari]UYK74725.1 A coat protein [Xanthomonas sacchari]
MRAIWLFVLLVVALPAFAESGCFSDTSEGYTVMCGDQGEASAGGYSVANKLKSGGVGGVGPDNIRVDGPTDINASSRTLVYKLVWISQGQTLWRIVRGWPEAKSCSDRNSTKLADAALWYSEPSTCIGGCQVQGTSFNSTSGSVKVYGMKDRTYTGDVCAAGKPSDDISQVQSDVSDANNPKAPECTALGSGQTGCQKTNGDYCATASTGKTFCWQPTETGKKTDGSDAQVKSPKGDPVTPPSVTIPDQEWQRNEGHQNTVCVNNTCTTYNVTNYSSVPGGTSKNSTGDNTPDGSGNTSGNGAPGKGTKDGDKDGDSDSATDSGNCTAPPACTGDTLKCLYLKYTWKNQCNTAHNEISKGDGCADSDVPVCAGSSCKAEAYAQLLQQWRSRCSAESMRKGVEDQAGQGDGDDGKGSIFISGDGDKPGLNEGLISYGGGDLGYSFDVEGIKFEMPHQVLDFIPVLRMLIIAAASLYAISIMRGQ